MKYKKIDLKISLIKLENIKVIKTNNFETNKMSNTLATALTQMANQSQFKTHGLEGAPVYETTQNPLIDAYIKLNLASTQEETNKHMSNIMTYINTSQDPESLVIHLLLLCISVTHEMVRVSEM